jgi:hypothetical protein
MLNSFGRISALDDRQKSELLVPQVDELSQRHSSKVKARDHPKQEKGGRG